MRTTAAERVPARSVLSKTPSLTAVRASTLQRCGAVPCPPSGCVGDHDRLLRQPAKSSSSGPVDVPSIVHEVVRSPGRPLDPRDRRWLQAGFGQDLSRVRVHTDQKAAASAKAVRALAYTVGPQVVFGERRYRPATDEGRRLLAHEVTHVLQQTKAGVTGAASPSRVSSQHDRAEQEASRMAEAISAEPPGDRQHLADLGRRLGRDTAAALLARPAHPAWRQVHAVSPAAGFLQPTADCHHRSCGTETRESTGGDEPPPGTDWLYARTGSWSCNLGGFPKLVVSNPDCTRTCSLLHELQHVTDLGPCCVRANIAYWTAGAGKPAVKATWIAHVNSVRAWTECNAYTRSVQCATAMHAMLLCWAPSAVVRSILIGTGALAGGAVGAAAGAAAGTAAGAGTGLAGGPTAPVTVPAGAVAGFVSGEVLGALAGAGLGALLGAGAEALREACCASVQKYRASMTAQRNKYCAAATPPAPCPF